MPTDPAAKRLSADHLAYHRYLLAESQRVKLALQSWSGFLANAYHLQVSDEICEDGQILQRVPTWEEFVAKGRAGTGLPPTNED